MENFKYMEYNEKLVLPLCQFEYGTNNELPWFYNLSYQLLNIC